VNRPGGRKAMGACNKKPKHICASSITNVSGLDEEREYFGSHYMKSRGKMSQSIVPIQLEGGVGG